MKTILMLILIGAFPAISLNAAGESADSPVKKHRGHKGSHFQASDKDSDGKLSKEEFVALQNRRLENRFKKLDKDGDGFLSKEEFATSSRHRK